MKDAAIFTCSDAGLVMKLTSCGATVVSVEAPGALTLGFPTLEGYLVRHPYFGSTVGRFCNRIARGRFTLDGTEYTLAANDGPNHLHGGDAGFDRVIWDAEEIPGGARFAYLSRDGEEGYPGNLRVTAEYTLAGGAMKVEFTATTDKPTPVNLTNHCYWNLAGSGTILDHEVTIAADRYLPVDETLIPTGELAEVKGTRFDFTASRPIGEGGYDHCFALNSGDGSLALAARVRDPKSGRVMEVHTTQPGIQFYTGNFLDGSPACGGFGKHGGFCLETQHFPDSPNRPEFPSTILRPGETYHEVTLHRFSVD
ncbi:MAG: aldose epimerase family protein [Planctomycetota bacterium]|jgi:aldose 1-epimerase